MLLRTWEMLNKWYLLLLMISKLCFFKQKNLLSIELINQYCGPLLEFLLCSLNFLMSYL